MTAFYGCCGNKMRTLLPGNIIIRPVSLSDVDVLLRLRLEALQESPEAFGEDYSYVAAQPLASWQERVAHSHGGGDQVIFIAARDDPANDTPGDPTQDQCVVGMAGVNRSTMRNTRHSASIWGVYVQPAYRGRGVAKALVQACVAWGQQKGLITMRLAVITANVAAIRCYESCGFRSCGVDPMAFFVNGRFYDLMRMTRLMAPEPAGNGVK